MEIKEFLQKCVDNGISSITTRTLATKFKLTRYQAYTALKKLRNDNAVSIFGSGSYSCWVINLPTTYDAMFEDYYEDDSPPEYEPRNAYEQDLADNGCTIIHRY